MYETTFETSKAWYLLQRSMNEISLSLGSILF